MYKENGYKVIFLHLFKDSNKWKKYFLYYLIEISKYRNDKLNGIIEKTG